MDEEDGEMYCGDEEEGGGDDGGEGGGEARSAALARLEALLVVDPERFSNDAA
jgi:hypothetical protein